MTHHLSDFPRVRASRVCPMCTGPKLAGAVTCWECHNDCELGAPRRRANREAILAIAEELESLKELTP